MKKGGEQGLKRRPREKQEPNTKTKTIKKTEEKTFIQPAAPNIFITIVVRLEQRKRRRKKKESSRQESSLALQPSPSSPEAAAPELHLQQPLHQKQGTPGEKYRDEPGKRRKN
jgi:hypothetical protein